jgi:GMP synthase (glutamine-hydrolysing)
MVSLPPPAVLVVLHDPDDNLGELAPPLAESGIRIVMWDAGRNPDAGPSSLDDFAGIISLGAYAGVREEAEKAWMPVEKALMQQAIERRMPVLGLCFGAQLLAAAAGAAFRPSPVPELGWTRVSPTPEAAADPVVAPLTGEGAMDVFHYHFDSFELPEGATLLGETDGIIEAFRVGECAWGLQFHLEVGLATQLAWIASDRGAFERAGAEPAEQEALSHEKWRQYRDRAHAVGAAFATEVRRFAER